MRAQRPRTHHVLVVLSLTAGIAADTAIFSVVNGVMLRPLPTRLGINSGFTCDLAAGDAALARGMAERNRLCDKTNENPSLNDKGRLAERVGFEPTVEFPLHTLSKRAP